MRFFDNIERKMMKTTNQMHWAWFPLLLILLNPSIHFAQNTQFLGADFATFRYDENQVYFDFYYSLQQNRLTPVFENGQFMCMTLLELEIFQNGELWTRKAWKNQNTVEDTSTDLWNVHLVDRISFLLPAGEFTLLLKAQDLHNVSMKDSLQIPVNLTSYPSDQPSLSDLILATSIERNSNDTENPFYRNTLVVIPNPTLLFGKDQMKLFYYLESYHISKNIQTPVYTIQYFITDADEKRVDQIAPVKIQRKTAGSDSRVEQGAVQLRSLPTGKYYFNFEMTDSEGVDICAKTKSFFIYNPEADQRLEAAAQDVLSQTAMLLFDGMSKEELDQEFAYTEYLLTTEVKKIYKALDDINGKKTFLARIWKQLDSNQETIQNEFREDYLARIQEANQKYARMGTEGWKTDRGRVLMIYGHPNSVDSYPYQEDSKPYEIWFYYDIQGGVQFIFADLMGFKNYELIHSTARGELHNSNYEAVLRLDTRF
jgi:GWxTD domain-containing protein